MIPRRKISRGIRVKPSQSRGLATSFEISTRATLSLPVTFLSIQITNLSSTSKAADYQLALSCGLGMNSSVVCFSFLGFNIRLRVCFMTMPSLMGKPISDACVIFKNLLRFLSCPGNACCHPCGRVRGHPFWRPSPRTSHRQLRTNVCGISSRSLPLATIDYHSGF